MTNDEFLADMKRRNAIPAGLDPQVILDFLNHPEPWPYENGLCDICGEEFDSQGYRRWYCGEECKAVANARRQRKYRASP
jgi:hypothetical protein